MSSIQKSHCRLCGGKLAPILDFGHSTLANELRSNKEQVQEEYPLVICKCENCDSVQLKHTVDPKVLFANYSYESSAGLDVHFKEYAEHTFDLLDLNKDSFVVGIGGNIGQLEKHYQNLGCKVLNIEPAENIANKSFQNGVKTVCAFFNESLAEDIAVRYGKADVITSNNCFAHIDNLTEILSGVKSLLSPSGFFIFENAYLLDTVRNTDLGQFYHEHLFYHSVKPLKLFFEKNGLKLVKIEYNQVQCGSFRIYATHDTHDVEFDDSIFTAIQTEEAMNLYDPSTYSRFSNKILDIKNRLEVLFDNIYCDRQRICMYGVPAKAVLILKLFNLSKYVLYAIEDAPNKIGKYVSGTNIKIYDSSYFKENPVEICFVGAYNFANSIINKNSWYKGAWIVPLPNVLVVNP
jgi:SAM-dependent methyltransferase